jgi:hypothetical protein
VAVTVGKKTTCKPLAKAIPKPQAIDPRLGYLQEALKFDVSKLGGRKAKHTRTLQSGFGGAGRRAQKKLLRILPKGLAMLDRLRHAGAGSSALEPGPAVASRGCGVGAAGPQGHTGGGTIGTLGDRGGFIESPPINGLTVRVTFVSCGWVDTFIVPSCPKSDGSVDASGSGDFQATIEVREGDRVVSRNSSFFEDEAKAHGQVGPDAKLRSIDLEHSQSVLIVASGGVVVRGGVVRKVRIEMPAGSYDSAGAQVRFTGDSLAADFGASAFSRTADGAIKSFRQAETGWSSFGRSTCAEPVFSPGANTLKLKKGDQKQLGVHARARAEGGTATGAIWSLSAPTNADFAPMSSQDASPNVQYTVSKSPQGKQVTVTVKFTSTAGVGEGTWTQPIESSGEIHHLSGEFGGEYKGVPKPPYGRTEQVWNGTISLAGNLKEGFELVSGSITVEVSGLDGTNLTLCQQEGTGTIDLLGAGLNLTTAGGGAVPEEPPYNYLLIDVTPSDPVVVHRFACHEKEQEEGYEGSEGQVVPNTFFFVEDVSSDGIDFSGTEDESTGGYTYVVHWSLHGSE